MSRLKKFFVAVVPFVVFLCIPINANATVFLNNKFESASCGTVISDGMNFEGVMWDSWLSSPLGTIRCATTSPSGGNYIEWDLQANCGSNGCGGTELYFSSPHTLVFGTTYYLASFVRFQRVSSQDIWTDTGSSPYHFNKLFEFQGSGFRWGVGSGWDGWYSNGTDHKFTFDIWYATSVLGEHGPDHIIADVSPYNAGNPLLSDYEMWHGVVLGVTASNSNSGRIQLWVDGVKVTDQPHYTALSGANIDEVIMNGTIAQPSYSHPRHFNQFDSILVTNNWQDVIDGNYLLGGADTTPPATPTGLGCV